MSLVAVIVVAGAAGAVLGALNFLALWKTVRRMPQRPDPGLWMAISMVLRLAMSLAVFVLLARWAGLPALAAALVGFVAVRTLFIRRLGRQDAQPASPS